MGGHKQAAPTANDALTIDEAAGARPTMIGLIIVFGGVLLDNTVRSQEDVESVLGLPFLGVFPSISATCATTAAVCRRRARREVAGSVPARICAATAEAASVRKFLAVTTTPAISCR